MLFYRRLFFFNCGIKFCKKKRRKSKRKKGSKHIYSYFMTRKKKYDLYFIPFDQKVIDKNSLCNKSKKSLRNKVGLKSYGLDLIRIECLKSLKFCNQRFLKSVYLEKNFKDNIYVLPDYFLTSKPKSIRMGKGKGESKFKVFFLKKNVPIYDLKFIFSRFNSFFVNRKLEFFKINLFIYFLVNTLSGKLSVKSKKFKLIL